MSNKVFGSSSDKKRDMFGETNLENAELELQKFAEQERKLEDLQSAFTNLLECT
jgi:hypothetical protein